MPVFGRSCHRHLCQWYVTQHHSPNFLSLYNIYIHIAVFAINMLEIILRRTQLSLRSVLIPVVPPPCNDGSIQSAELGQGNYPNGTQISIRQPEICSNGDYVPVCQDGLGVDASIGICAVQFGYFGMLPLTVSYTAQTDM